MDKKVFLRDINLSETVEYIQNHKEFGKAVFMKFENAGKDDEEIRKNGRLVYNVMIVFKKGNCCSNNSK